MEHNHCSSTPIKDFRWPAQVFVTVKQIGKLDCYGVTKGNTSFIDAHDEKFGLLHACAESKRVVQKTCQLIFGTANSEGFYSDLNKDILYFSFGLVTHRFWLPLVFDSFPEYSNAIRHIAFDVKFLSRRQEEECLLRMKGLRTFFHIKCNITSAASKFHVAKSC